MNYSTILHVHIVNVLVQYIDVQSIVSNFSEQSHKVQQIENQRAVKVIHGGKNQIN